MIKKRNILLGFILFNIGINMILSFQGTKSKRVLLGKNVHADFHMQTEYTKEVNDLYVKEGSMVLNGKEISVNLHTEYLKMNFVGDSYVLYDAKISDYRTEEYYQKITVVDTTAPRISFKGTEVMYIKKGSVYKEPGYEAIDNYDGDLTSKVKIEGKVNTKEEGSYTLLYTVSDKSNNQASRMRTVIVKEEVEEYKEEEKEKTWDPEEYTNTLTYMEIKDNILYVRGYVKESASTYQMKIEGKEKKSFSLKEDGHYYEGEIPLKDLKNGEYIFYIKAKEKEYLKAKQPDLEKIVRFKIEKKLVTFSYEDDKVQMKIQPFSYEYDIVIDPGHGGLDTGAVVNGAIEKDINLEQSLYEKKRFEDHGYKVKLLREDDSYGEILGSEEWIPVQNRAYALGYYGVVSKYAYSNHHNSIDNPTYMGWEILVPSVCTYQDLQLQHTIIEAWNQIYTLTENHIRMYARNYDTGGIYNKINGQVYAFKNYYAVNRIPLLLFGVKTVIYEGSYMSNEADFNWYYVNENYKQLSELKVKAYIEALGGTYKPLE